MSFQLIVAHRGYSAIAPENTLASLRKALEAGAHACEIDVHLTGDGEVVVMHDGTVDRTTNGTGALREMTLDQVRRLDAGAWKGPEYAGEPVPTLAEVLALLDGRAHLVCEVKDADIEEAVARTIVDAGAIERVTFIAFDHQMCARLRDVLPSVGVLWLIGDGDHDPGAVAEACLESNLQGVDAFYGAISEELADTLLRRGLSLWAWTVNQGDEALRLASLGVTSITTDDPVLIASALG